MGNGKIETNWDDFLRSVSSWRQFSSRSAEIFLNDDYVFKIFNSSTPINRRKENYIDFLASLDPNLLTIPDRKVYINGEYYGYRMENGGSPLLDYIIDNNVNFDEKVKIVYVIKKIIKYLDAQGIIHGDFRLANLLYKEGIIRLTDLNSILFPGDKPYDMPTLHLWWYNSIDSSILIDNLAFNLLTYILLNYENTVIKWAMERGINAFNVSSVFDNDKNLFDHEVMDVVKNAILNKCGAMRQLKPDTYLIDYLK